MSFTKVFPVNIGTFVIVDHKDVDLTNPNVLLGRFGSIECYQCVDDEDDNEYTVMVSGYKDSWCGEYLLSDVVIATEEQVKMYEKIMGI